MAQSPYSRFGTSELTGTSQSQAQHTIIAGETIPKITAAAFNTGYDSELWRQVAEANDIDDLDAVTVGTVIVIPSPQPSST